MWSRSSLLVPVVDAASLDLSGRDYYVSRVASTESRGRENIARAAVSFTWRLYRRHAITLKFVASFQWAPSIEVLSGMTGS